MIQGVRSFRFGELVVNVVQKVEGVHVVELGRVILIEDLLLIRVKVLPIVHDHLPVASTNEPLVIRLEE